ncbi:transcriptional regulator [Kytococcus sedentarius DSM 20547]|uniref:Transcriptional regulator n=1 Tax=Kytococcus sedentarius (strain ATCC 14392 / DSM 20547 / JCM 11482 / CCUG 33030 / NBRC 15357 / NCTC 11040 / CCM 314 / 541) TaxID=478801 RepID=C7NFD0_KYTSD|nr:transcriptional regulator [Kytococcus sedentarius DSM 20547]
MGLQVPELTPGAQRIVEVASELFYRRGIHAVGVDTIARESGITKRTLYDRFGSKDALVAVYLQSRHQRWWELLERRITDTPSPRVLAVFDAYADDEWASDRGCGFLNAAGELAAEHPAYQVVRAHKQAVRDRLAELVRADCLNVDDPETMAAHLFLLLEGAIAHRGIDDETALLTSARELAEHLVLRPTASGEMRINQ